MLPALPRFSVAVLGCLALAGVSAKLAIAAQLAADERSAGPLAWSASCVGGELVLAALVALLAAFATQAWARASVIGSTVLLASWMDANVLSYAIDQSPITWWRLRGGEGGGIDALGLLEPRDAALVVGLALAQCVAAVFIVRGLGRVERPTPRAPWAALGLGIAIMLVDRGYASPYNRGLGEQSVFLFVASLAGNATAGSEDTRSWTPERWAAVVHKPLEREPLAGIPRAEAPAKNAIIFFAEGIPRELTTLGDPELPSTPRLAARTKDNGVELAFHHATFHRSIAALFSLACSDYPPPDGAGISEVNPRADCGEASTLLAASGVRSGYFHSGPFGFYDKLAFFGGRKWDVLKDAASLQGEQWWRHRWGVDDRATVAATLDWIDGLKGERFFAFVVPIAAHYPYEVPPDVAQATGDSKRDRFLADTAYIDLVFDQLMQGLEQRGIAKDTLVIFLADHGAIFPKKRKKTRGARLAYESNLHVPAAMFGPPLSGPGKYTALSSHLDLLPTVLDGMGLPSDPRHVGHSLFKPAPAERVFLGARSGDAEIVGFIDGARKVLVDRRTGAMEVYDLDKDPDEQRDLTAKLSADEQEALRAEALAYASAQSAHLRTMSNLGDQVDIPAAVLAKATVSVERGGAQLACGKQGEAWHCDDVDAPVVAGRREAMVDGVSRDCLIIQPPARATLRLTIDGEPSLLSFVSQARLGRTEGRPGTGPGSGSYLLSVRSDGASSDDVDATNGKRGRLAGKAVARVSYAIARQRLEIDVRALGDNSEALCLALDDKSWRAKDDPFD